MVSPSSTSGTATGGSDPRIPRAARGAWPRAPGNSHNGRLTEIVELPNHPFFVAGQFHPELRSRPTRPHPLFEFVGAAQAYRRAQVARRSRSRVTHSWRSRGRHTVYRGAFIRVDLEDWPELGEWEVVRRFDATAVLPVTPDDDVLLVRQFRPAISPVVEMPAGILVGGRTPSARPRASCSRNPLPARGRSSSRCTRRSVRATSTCTCSGLARVPSPTVPVEPGIELVVRPLGRMIDAARSGRVRDAKTALALLMAAGRPSLIARVTSLSLVQYACGGNGQRVAARSARDAARDAEEALGGTWGSPGK